MATYVLRETILRRKPLRTQRPTRSLPDRMSERKVIKRDGRVVSFDPSRIERAIKRAMLEERQYDETKLRAVLRGVLSVIEGLYSAGKTPNVEEIQDIVEMQLVKQNLFTVAKSYIIYRKERERIRAEKQGILKKEPLDEVDKRYSVNALKLLAARYLQKGSEGNFIEDPKGMFKRVAALVVVSDILHDQKLFSKDGGQKIREPETWNPEEWGSKVGLKGPEGVFEFTWNKYHLERMKALYDELNEQGKMKKSWSETWDSLLRGEFDYHLKEFNDYYSLMSTKRFLPNSPTLFNAGTLLGQLSACFVLSIEDDIESIMTAASDGAVIFKSGGGIGLNYSALRPAGDMVFTTSGVASGPVSFMKIIDTVTEVVRQGGRRRGANMGILDIDHPDIEKFIMCKSEPGKFENFNISVMVKENFWDCLAKNEPYPLVNPRNGKVQEKVDPTWLFEMIAKQAWKNGDPGVVFFDNLNRRNVMKSVLGPITSTNPCVTGDTRVSTDRGMIKISDLCAHQIPIKVVVDARIGPTPILVYPYGLSQRSRAYEAPGTRLEETATVVRTGIKPVHEIKTGHGYSIKATPDHRFYTESGWKRVADLREGDMLYLQSGSGGFGWYGTLEVGRLLGWIVGDGDLSGRRIYLRFYGKDREVAPVIADGMAELTGRYPKINHNAKQDCAYMISRRLYHELRNCFPKGRRLVVPEIVFRGSREMQGGFLQGLFEADSCVNITANRSCSICLTSISVRLLRQVQLLLLNFGVVSKIYTNRRRGQTKLMPNGRGGHSRYWCRAYHELSIDGESRDKFAAAIGYLSKGKQSKLNRWIETKRRRSNREEYLTAVKSIRFVGEEWVYDLKEPVTHSFIANGIVAHNCGEEPLYPYESCNLGSLNLYAFINEDEEGKKRLDWESLKSSIGVAVRFLDNIIDVNRFPFPAIERATKRTRKIGLGMMGLADALFALDIPYNSEDGFEFMEKVAEFLSYWAMCESTQMSTKRGAFPLCSSSAYSQGDLPVEGYYHKEEWGQDWVNLVSKIKEKGMRNAECTTIAPTGSISMIADTSSGIEPAYALAYEKRVTVGNFYYVDEEFEKKLKRTQAYSEKLLKDISDNGGSLQGLESATKNLTAVFQTALDIPWWDHVRAQAIFAKWMAAAVSKTINMPSWVGVSDVLKAYLFAHRMGVKGVTVYRDGSRMGQVLVAPSSKRGGYVALVKNNTIQMMKTLGIEVAEQTELKGGESAPSEGMGGNVSASGSVAVSINEVNGEKCPSCGSTRISREGGCAICMDCGWSRCPVA